jgi:transcription elongation factor GreA
MTNTAETPYVSPSTRLDAPRAIITPDGERALREELDRLRVELEVDYPQRLRQAREFGEGGNNDDHLQIKEEEAVLRSRIARLEALLESATVAVGRPSDNGMIGIGAVVEVENSRSGRRATHRLIGSFAPQEAGDVSASSPVGQALLGRSVGDSVEVELPNGRTRKFKIVAVSAAGEG